jgi:hypothetical protein
MPAPFVRYGGVYFPSDGSSKIIYLLCDTCGEKLGNEGTRLEVLHSVELRLGRMGGAA